MRTADEVRHIIELLCGGGITAGLTFAYILVAGRLLAPSACGKFVGVAARPLRPTIIGAL